jgi:hypothetical protein
MAKTPPTPERTLPKALQQLNQTKFQRTVRLTRQAITKLQHEGQTVTLAAIAEATRLFDEDSKGITPTTILRNPEAATLFRQHSPAYQARQQQLKRSKRKAPRAKLDAQTRATYRGLRSSDLIQMIEDLKKQITELKAERDKLKAERDEAYRLRDEALQQNTRQLAALTKLMNQPDPKPLETKDDLVQDLNC